MIDAPGLLSVTGSDSAEPAPHSVLEKLIAVVWFVGPIAGFALLWQLADQFRLVNPTLIPPPTAVAARLWVAATPAGQYVLERSLWASTLRVVPGFAIGALAGVSLGVAIGLNRTVAQYCNPLLSLLLPLPAVVWVPVFLVSLGRGDRTMITVIALGVVFPVLFNTVVGVQSATKREIWVLQSMGADTRAVLRYVVLPAALPAIITGCKLGIAHAWRAMVAVEMLASAALGLGALIFNAREFMDTSMMFGGIVALAFIGLALEHLVFGAWERATIARWRGRTA